MTTTGAPRLMNTHAQVNVLLNTDAADPERTEVRVGPGGNIATWMQVGPVTFIASPSSYEECEAMLRFADRLELAVDDFVSAIRRVQGHFPEPTTPAGAILTGPRKED